MVINACPAATTKAPPDAVWTVIEATERLGEWTDAEVVGVEPPGPARKGQVVRLVASSLGRRWSVEIEVAAVDPGRRWIDLVAHLPFGVDNHEHLTLTETKDGGTLVRFN